MRRIEPKEKNLSAAKVGVGMGLGLEAVKIKLKAKTHLYVGEGSSVNLGLVARPAVSLGVLVPKAGSLEHLKNDKPMLLSQLESSNMEKTREVSPDRGTGDPDAARLVLEEVLGGMGQFSMVWV
jgi:hypothetical protein